MNYKKEAIILSVSVLVVLAIITAYFVADAYNHADTYETGRVYDEATGIYTVTFLDGHTAEVDMDLWWNNEIDWYGNPVID